MLIYLQLIDDPRDRSKFEQLYQQYRGLMHYIANRILRNDRDAEDAVHEAFVTLIENIEKISDIRCHKTKSYIVTITENKAIDLYRRKQKHPTGELIEELQGLTAEDEVDDGLTRCILKLPARYREVILLRYEQGISYGEMARLMGISQPTARKLVQRARDRLETICREEGVL